MTPDPRPPADLPTPLSTAAHTALACLDLTSLNDADTEADVARLCERAQGPHGAVAAVCVWPRFAAFARARLPAHIAVAAVANFPDGSVDTERALRDTAAIVQAGAQEVDVVLPFASLMAGDAAAAARLLAVVRTACPGLRLKVILETGVLMSVLAGDGRVGEAARIALDCGADFLKTSTGKTAVSATPQAARVMLQTIAATPGAAGRVGFKASGGIRTVAEAAVYMRLCTELLDTQALLPARFRLGASSLLNDIEAVLDGRAAAPGAAPGAY